MNIKKETIRLGENMHKVYFMDDLNQWYKVILEKGLFGTERISKKVFTDGDIVIISKNDNDIECNVEVVFETENANWIVKLVKEDIKVFVKKDFDGTIDTKNPKLNELVAYCIDESKKRMENKKAFANNMGKIAIKENLPFKLTLAFKGEVKDMQDFIKSLEKAIYNCYGSDSIVLQDITSRNDDLRKETLDYIGIKLPELSIKSHLDVCKYVKSCLIKGKILKYNEW